jgi:predicted ATPase/DNA-binding CsgD family transcriptional regulator
MNPAPLTERENDVLALMAGGLTNRQIAGQLSLEQSTVRWYARQIYAKLGAEDRQHALSRALELGLLPGAAPPLPPTNLPAALTPFVGRQSEMQQLAALLRDPAVRLITITGPGGIGKTRLALAAAAAQLSQRAGPEAAFAPRFPGGVWFVPLAALGGPAGLAPAIAHELGLALESRSGRPPLEQLGSYLRARRLLLVLDDFDQLLESAQLLGDLLAAAAGVTLLVTSRERLGLPGEQAFPLVGLDLPGASASASASEQLFLHTARRVQPDLVLTGEDEAALRRICQTVAGIPLAIELAASWATVLPLAHIAGEIEKGLALLATEADGWLPRHRSMQATLDASWRRLSAEQQIAFLQLCLFRGGFTRHAAHEVAAVTLPLLVQLVFKSWLLYDQQADRYRIHELLRQYGLQRLDKDESLYAAARQAYVAHFITFLQEREPGFHGPRQQEVVAEIRAEAGNVWQAWQWAVAAQDVARLAQALDPLCRYLTWSGRIADAALACRTAADSLPPDGLDASTGILHARLALWQARFSSAAAARTALLDRCQALLDHAAGAAVDSLRARLHLQRAAEETGVRQTLDHLERAAALFQAAGDGPGLSQTLLEQAHALLRLGEPAAAEAAATEGLALSQRAGNPLRIADGLSMLALIHKHRDQAERAQALQREALQQYQQLQHPLLEMETAADLANTLWWLGRFDEMLAFAGDAIAIQDHLGLEPSAYLAITHARALLHLGRYPESQHAAEQALALARTAGSIFAPFVLLHLAQVALVAAPPTAVVDREAMVAGMLDLWPNEAAQAYAVRALLALRAGDQPAAAAAIRDGLRWASDRRTYAAAHYCLVAAALALAPADPERAVELHALTQTFPHIAHSRWFADIAGQELERVAAALPAATVAALRTGGADRDLWQTVAELAAAV